jgi:hypothetical protein
MMKVVAYSHYFVPIVGGVETSVEAMAKRTLGYVKILRVPRT